MYIVAAAVRVGVVCFVGLVGLSTYGNIPPDDGSFACTAQSEASKYTGDYNIRLRSFPQVDLCSPNNELNQLFHSLKIIELGGFGGQEGSPFIKNWVPEDEYYKWVETRVYSIRRGHDVPYATAYNMGGDITVQDGWAKLSTLGKVGTLIHEARHTDGYSHTACTHGPYAKSRVSGCDYSLKSGGAHGVEMEYYSRVVLQGHNFHPVYKSMARLMLLARSHFVFNKNPLKQSFQTLLANGQGALFVEDRQGLTQVGNVGSTTGWKIKSASFGPVLYNGMEAFGVDIYDRTVLPHRDEYSYFKLLKLATPENFKDFEEIDLKDRKYVVALGLSGTVYQYSFPRGTWEKLGTWPQAVAFHRRIPGGGNGLYVLGQNGDLLSVDLPAGKIRHEKGFEWPEDVVSFGVLGGRDVELRKDGLVYFYGTDLLAVKLSGVSHLIQVPTYVER